MKKTWLILLSCFMSVYFLALPSSFAKAYDAIITRVANGGGSLTATVTDEYGITEKDMTFYVSPNVELTDYQSIQEIQTGQQVKFSADKDGDGNWQISKLEALKK